MKLRLVLLGKTRRTECRALLEDYVSRIRRYAECECVELREASPAALRRLKIEKSAACVLLDAAGKHLTTAQFACWLGELRDRGTRELVLLCGDASGFPEELRRRAAHKLALSAFTMPHELARVVLVEQLYRAFTILAGHPYSK